MIRPKYSDKIHAVKFDILIGTQGSKRFHFVDNFSIAMAGAIVGFMQLQKHGLGLPGNALQIIIGGP